MSKRRSILTKSSSNKNNVGRSALRSSTYRRKNHHVSFKLTPSSHKSNIKLGAKDSQRETSSESKKRLNFRRRSSPVPLGSKFRNGKAKLVENSDGWYQVTIYHGRDAYDQKILMGSLLSVLKPQTFQPQYWSSYVHTAKFYINDFELAKRIQKNAYRAQLPNGYHLSLRVCGGSPLVNINDEFKLKMKAVLAKRYNHQFNAIDLTRFQADDDLKPTFCPLFRVDVMTAALDIICENIPYVEAMNLNDNNISTLEAFRGVEKRLPLLKIIYLGGNKLPLLAYLLPICKLPIEELVLRNNPCSLRYQDSAEYFYEVRRKFPKLRQLDGKMLQLPLQAPTAESTFLRTSAGKDVVLQFLDQYFNIFDSDNRQPLLDAYHENSMLSISLSQEGQLEQFNRIQQRSSTPERENSRMHLLKRGRLACVSALIEWPRTLHVRHTFNIDLTFNNPPRLMVFTVTGLFKEFPNNAPPNSCPTTQSYKLHHFMRTIEMVQQNEGYCIRNETIFLARATEEQTSEFMRAELQQKLANDSSNLTVGNSPDEAAAHIGASLESN